MEYFGKAESAEELNQIAEYKEKLNLIIMEEIAERKTQKKDKSMIESLDEKIRTKESSWVQEIYKCDNHKQIQETFETSTHLLVESKENYEFFIEVNEEQCVAKIISEEKGSAGKWKLTYNPNEAEGNQEIVEVKKGFPITIKGCGNLIRDGYVFAEWNTKKDGTGNSYKEGDKIKLEEDVTLYAIWKVRVSAGVSDASSYYGAIVEGYSLETVNGINYNEGVSNWKIFHIDDNNIYLIADYFIQKKYCPSSKNYAIGSYSNHALTMFNVIKDYTGTGDIIDNEIKALNSKYFEYLTINNKTNTAINAKAMAYMLDKEVWSVYKGEGAKYAIGGPTVELLLNSYNKKYGTSYSCEVQHEYGYTQPYVSFSTSDSLYVITKRPQGEYTQNYFVASPYTWKTGRRATEQGCYAELILKER